jgi:nucleoside-triphosphatase
MAAGMWIISAPGGSGKTTCCEALAQRAKTRGLAPKGVLSPALFEGGRKAGIDIVDLASGERRHLALARTPESTGIVTDAWCFEVDSLDWANKILRQLDDAPLVIVDELGPLEFNRAQGLVEGMFLLDRRSSGASLVVIRPKHLQQALARWPRSKVVEVSNAQTWIEVILDKVHAQRS